LSQTAAPATAAGLGTRADGPLKVALYSGIYVRHDAVSNSLHAKLEALRRLLALGAPIELTVFTHASDLAAPEIRVVPSVSRLVGTEEFWSADVHIFEFGMYYDLFDSMFVIPDDRPKLVIEHNTTPPELVDLPEVRAGCQLALVQRHNLRLAGRVACVSEFNLAMARSVGVPEDRLSVLHLPPAHEARLAPRTFGGADGGARPVRLLFVGRLVRAKGVGDLLAMAERLWASRPGQFTLDLVGSPTFSDPEVFEAVERSLADHGGAGDLRLHASLSEADMAAMFKASDLLVIPSYHEGYCVPVIEALAAGCHVVGYDAGNLPNVVAGLGQLVPTGDVAALGDAVGRFIDRARAAGRRGTPISVPTAGGDVDETAWLAAVRAHLADYTAAHFERTFLELFAQLAQDSPKGLSPALEAALGRRRAEVAALP